MPGLSDAIGELFVKVSPDTTGFGAKTAAGVKAQSSGAAGGFSKAGTLVGGAMVAGAVGAFAKGIGDFKDFEKGMNEVFTLIPDAGQGAFDELESQVKSFSKETGVLTADVIPSLYDSISAGVPRENVFGFLEDANKFAKAGAVDLSTAVDGLTTGLNAYQLGAGEAGRVSDALFTGVKLGKTTVQELSDSLFQVAPIANLVGVPIEQVSASLATLTAQGTPTKVAATQMKAAFSELAKGGTKADKAFQDIAGQTFTEFIEGGGDIVQAAGMMAAGADEAGISMLDMFGSVEAGQAMVGLSADLEKSAANLEAVNNAAGATEEAFDQMEQGIGPALDKLKATVSVAFLEIGDAVAPVIMDLLPIVSEFASLIAALPGPVLAAGLAGIALAGGLLMLAGPIMKVIKLMQLLKLAMLANPWVILAVAVVALAVVVYKNWETIKTTVGDALDWMADKLEVFVWWATEQFARLTQFLKPILDVLQEIWSFAFNAMSTFLESWQGRLTALWDNLTQWFSNAMQFLSDIITPIWNFMWDEMIMKIQIVWAIIQGAIEIGTAVVTGLLNTLLAPIGGISGALEAMKGVWETTWNGVKIVMQSAYDFVVMMAGKIGDAVKSALGPVGDLAGAAGGLLGGGARLLGFDEGGVVPGPKGAPRMILAHAGETILPTHKDPNAGGAGTTISINMGGVSMSNDMDVVETGRALAREVEREMQAAGS